MNTYMKPEILCRCGHQGVPILWRKTNANSIYFIRAKCRSCMRVIKYLPPVDFWVAELERQELEPDRKKAGQQDLFS